MIDRARILTMIPHAGAMCLLDAVLSWDADAVCCLSRRYRARDNPLRRADGMLGAACGVEIAAQAMAVHGHLLAGAAGPPARGFLVSLRDVRLLTRHLDAGAAPLRIEATRLLGDAGGARYRFVLTAEGAELLSGRATVLFGLGA